MSQQPPRATNPSNQATVDHLFELSQKPRFSNSQHYPRIFRKGIKGLAKCHTVVNTFSEATKLSGIGNFLAKEIVTFLDAAGVDSMATAAPDAPDVPDDSTPDVPPPPSRRRRGAMPTTTTNPSTFISPKESAYQESKNKALSTLPLLPTYSHWRVILLLDTREQQAHHVQAKLLSCGVECEQRQLPVGDMLWIARCRQDVEIVLGTIIERKTDADLASSIFGTRFEEQRLRMKECAGQGQVMYLVECRELRDLPNCPVKTLRSAMMNTMVHLGFVVLRSAGLEETGRLLRRVHLRVMKRAFPEEFQVRFGRSQRPLFASPVRTSGAGNMDADMVFHSPPVPFEGRDKVTLYEEFKAKIELDRERGTRSVGAVFKAQLKQLEGMSIKKVVALSKLYSTPSSLLKAYDLCEDTETMLEDVSVGLRERINRIGPKCSREIDIVFNHGKRQRRRIVEALERQQANNIAVENGNETSDSSKRQISHDSHNTTPKRTNTGKYHKSPINNSHQANATQAKAAEEIIQLDLSQSSQESLTPPKFHDVPTTNELNSRNSMDHSFDTWQTPPPPVVTDISSTRQDNNSGNIDTPTLSEKEKHQESPHSSSSRPPDIDHPKIRRRGEIISVGKFQDVPATNELNSRNSMDHSFDTWQTPPPPVMNNISFTRQNNNSGNIDTPTLSEKEKHQESPHSSSSRPPDIDHPEIRRRGEIISLDFSQSSEESMGMSHLSSSREAHILSHLPDINSIEMTTDTATTTNTTGYIETFDLTQDSDDDDDDNNHQTHHTSIKITHDVDSHNSTPLQSSSSSTVLLTVDEQIANALRNDPSLHLLLLDHKAVDISQILNTVTKAGVKIKKKDLVAFLEKRGVCFADAWRTTTTGQQKRKTKGKGNSEGNLDDGGEA